ncbi:hypothetical protein AAU61_02205 [Desulfocarbo indianensis]|nr:hypothetical protein AAU61_02205 [Desulfocarbo indianensis]
MNRTSAAHDRPRPGAGPPARCYARETLHPYKLRGEEAASAARSLPGLNPCAAAGGVMQKIWR